MTQGDQGVGPTQAQRAVGIGPDATATLRRVSEQGGTGEGRFEYSAERLGSLIQRWQRLADEYAEDVRAVRPLADIEAPGADPASERHAAQTSEPGKALLESLVERRDYCQAQADKCRRASGDAGSPKEPRVSPTDPPRSSAVELSVAAHRFPIADRGFPVTDRPFPARDWDFPVADQDEPFGEVGEEPLFAAGAPIERYTPRHGAG